MCSSAFDLIIDILSTAGVFRPIGKFARMVYFVRLEWLIRLRRLLLFVMSTIQAICEIYSMCGIDTIRLIDRAVWAGTICPTSALLWFGSLVLLVPFVRIARHVPSVILALVTPLGVRERGARNI